jgi:hypothetical protein
MRILLGGWVGPWAAVMFWVLGPMGKYMIHWVNKGVGFTMQL